MPRVVLGFAAFVGSVVEVYGNAFSEIPRRNIVRIDKVNSPVFPRSAVGHYVHDRFGRDRIAYRARIGIDRRLVRVIVARTHDLVGYVDRDCHLFGSEPFGNHRAVGVYDGMVPRSVAVEVVRESHVGIGKIAFVSDKGIPRVARQIDAGRLGISPTYNLGRAVTAQRADLSQRIGGEIGALRQKRNEQGIEFGFVHAEHCGELCALFEINLFGFVAGDESVFVIQRIVYEVFVAAVCQFFSENIDK